MERDRARLLKSVWRLTFYPEELFTGCRRTRHASAPCLGVARKGSYGNCKDRSLFPLWTPAEWPPPHSALPHTAFLRLLSTPVLKPSPLVQRSATPSLSLCLSFSRKLMAYSVETPHTCDCACTQAHIHTHIEIMHLHRNCYTVEAKVQLLLNTYYEI